VVALIRGNKLFVANAGDSRCIMSRRGKVVTDLISIVQRIPWKMKKA
jgi:serine/threonine protein phosphatase PrpC